MATVASVTKEVVKNAIDRDYIRDCGCKTLGEVFNKEYSHAGLNDKACKDYLMGLAGVCPIPFMNSEILELIYSRGVDRVAARGEPQLIERYWEACGAHLHKLIRDGE